MKKLDIICIIIGVICFLLAGYIVYSKFFKENKIDFNKEEEIKLLDDKLAKIGTPLGWLIITDGIDHQNEDGTKYNISYGTNLLKEYSNRQLFTMEYILSTKNENDKFILLSGFDNNKIEEKLKQVFRPEFLNRIDEIIVFDSLTKPELLQIVELMLKDTVKALADKNISLNVSENAKDFILEKGTNLKYGARPLRRAIQRYVEDEISEMILKGDVHDGQTINVDIENNELKFNVE